MWEPQDGEQDWERAGCRLGSHVLPSSGCADRSQALLTVSSQEGLGHMLWICWQPTDSGREKEA